MNKILKINLALLMVGSWNITVGGLSSCSVEKTAKISKDEHCEIHPLQDHVVDGQDYIVEIKYLDGYVLDEAKVTINNIVVSKNVAYTFDDEQNHLIVFAKYITGNINIEIKTKINSFINPEIEQTFEAKFYKPKNDQNSQEWVLNENEDSLDVTFFKQTSSIPYISIDKMFDYYDLHDDDHYKIVNDEKNITKIINQQNNTLATVDANQQKIIFSDWDKFLCNLTNETLKQNPLASICYDADNNYIKVIESKSHYQTKNEPYEMNFKKYDINIFYSQNTCYLPYDVYFELLFSEIWPTYIFNGHDFYQKLTSKSFSLYKNLDTKWIDKQYLKYNYNVLALKLDNIYGLDERLSRSNNYQPIKYLSNGAYAALEPYKDGLTSLEPNKSNKTLINFVAENLDDGGHTSYTNSIDLLSTINMSNQTGAETMYTNYVHSAMNYARAQAKLTPGDFMEYPLPVMFVLNNGDPTSYIYRDPNDKAKWFYTNPNDENDIIIYVVFDKFIQPTLNDGGTWSIGKNSVKYSNVNEKNYYFDTIRLTMFADKLVRKYKSENKKVSLVVDLSNNIGGVGFTECFISSWLCGEVKQAAQNIHTGSFSTFTYQADVNSDGKFDENDCIPDDVKVYCITSNGSFSCGSLLPVNLMENKKNNMFFIGEPSGGGSCAVGLISLPIISSYVRVSSYYHLLMGKSTNDNRLTVDVGTKDATYFYPISNDKFVDFFDRDTINKKIWNIN